MKKAYIAILIISALITAGIVIFGIYGYATRGVVDKTFTYTYTSSGTPEENVNITSDISKVIIQYNNTPMDYSMIAHLDIHIEGLYMAGKTYDSFFNIPVTQNNTATKSIEFTIKPGVWFDPSNWFSTKTAVLTLILRTDLVYDLDILVTTGEIDAEFPNNVEIADLNLETTTGKCSALFLGNNTVNKINIMATTGAITFSATNINITGDISIITTTGSLSASILNSTLYGDFSSEVTTGATIITMNYNEFPGGSEWTIQGTTGGIDLNIIQDGNMGGDVTGTCSVTTGGVDVDYTDTSNLVGAQFTGSTDTGTQTYNDNGGFGPSSSPFTSTDYGTASYTCTLSLSTTTGNIVVDGESA